MYVSVAVMFCSVNTNPLVVLWPSLKNSGGAKILTVAKSLCRQPVWMKGKYFSTHFT